METILEFFVNNYLWFLIISLILIFGLIGYIVDTNEKKSPKLHFQDEELEKSEPLEEHRPETLAEMLQAQSIANEQNATENNNINGTIATNDTVEQKNVLAENKVQTSVQEELPKQ